MLFMEKLIKSSRIESPKSSHLIQLCRYSSGNYFVKLEQTILENLERNTININSSQLLTIIETLTIYAEELKFLDAIIENSTIKKEEQQSIISTFLKGITIKDLSLQFRYPENDIRELLIKNNIVIIEGIKMSSQKFKYRKKR